MIRLDFEKYQLGNGLEVILRKDDRLPIVAVNLWYHVGPANEAEGRTGFAHLFEHMMFQGSGHTEEDSYFKHLEKAGASFVNGTTWFDRTNYMEDVPSNQLELALWLESDRMGFLLDKLDRVMLANQQDVVRNERRQSIENAPYGLADEMVCQMLFPTGHPYYGYVIGSHEDVQAAKLEDVHDFFRKYYAPNNASLAIVGDIDVAKTKALVEKYFGSIPRSPDAPMTRVETPPITSERRAVVTDRVELPRVFLAWITAAAFQPGDAEADLAAQILAGGKASRLYKSLVYEKKFAQSVTAEQQSLALGSMFQITVTAKPGYGAAELEAAIDTELDALAAQGPTDGELAAAKSVILSRTIMQLEELGGFSGVAEHLNFYNHYRGDPGYFDQDLARYAAATVEDIRELVAQTLRRDARVVVHAVPGAKIVPEGPPTPPAPERTKAPVESAEPWRYRIPAPGPFPARPLPEAKRFHLANGLSVYLTESHALPVVSCRLVVRSGSGADPADRPGLAGFSTAMLDEGTGKRDALGIARDLESLGARLGVDIGRDASHLTLRSLKQNAAAAMKILSEVVLEAAFPDSEIERVRHDRLTAVLQERDSPFRIALRALVPALYGTDHPYGHLAIGTEEALRAMTREDLVSFYRTAFVPRNAALVLAGDLNESEARALAEEAFGSWSGAARANPEPMVPSVEAERVLIVDKPGAPQTFLLVAQLGVKRSDPDFELLNAMNQILGGLFTSRINLNLRERNGYTYGAFSSLVETRGIGPFVISASVRNEVAGAALGEILKEVHGMREGEVNAEEVELARESLSRSLPALFETSASTAATIGELYVFDLPQDYYQGLPARLASLSAADVERVAGTHLDPARMIAVVVGDRKIVEPQVARLGLGATGYRAPDGKLEGVSASTRSAAAPRKR